MPKLTGKSVMALLAATVPLVFYLLTLCPTVYVGDSGELALAAANLEISHPPGYPLLTLVGHVWAELLGFLRPILALNILAATFAAATGLLLFLVLSRQTNRNIDGLPAYLIALAVSVTVCLGQTLWAAATSFEVYSLAALLFLLTLFCWLEFDRRNSIRFFLSGCYLFGLIFTNHFSVVALAPLPLMILLRQRRLLKLRHYLLGGLLLLLPASLYLYPFIRSRFDLVLDWYNPETLFGLKQLVFAETYQRYLAAPVLADIPPYLTQFWQLISTEFVLPFVVLGLVGFYLQLRRQSWLAWSMLLVVMLNLLLNFSYVIIDIAPYYLPTIIVAGIWIGELLFHLATCHRLFAWPVTLAAMGLAAVVATGNFAANDLSAGDASEKYALDLFARTPESGLLFCSSDNSMFPTLYLRYAEDFRTDTEVYGTLSTLPKLQRDLGVSGQPGFISFPPLLDLLLDHSLRPIVLSRDYLQDQDPVISGLFRGDLVSSFDSTHLIRPAYDQVDWHDPPHTEDPKLALLYANYFLANSEFATVNEAEKLLRRGIGLIEDTRSPILCSALTSYLFDAGRTTEARQMIDFTMALPTLRQRFRVHLLHTQGELLLTLGDTESAAAIFRQVLEIEPDYTASQFQLLALDARAAAAAADWTRAISLYQQMTELAPDQIEVYFQLGMASLEGGKREQALRAFAVCREADYRIEAIAAALADSVAPQQPGSP